MIALDTRSGARTERHETPSADCPDPAGNRTLVEVAEALREQRRFRLEQLADLSATSVEGVNPYGSTEVRANLTFAATHALAEIDAALARLDDGSYGTCTACGQQISPDRLEILPAAAFCMDCQYRAELRRSPVPARAVGTTRRTR